MVDFRITLTLCIAEARKPRRTEVFYYWVYGWQKCVFIFRIHHKLARGRGEYIALGEENLSMMFKTLLQRCHQRHQKPLHQRKTVAIPTMHTQEHFFQYRVYCARKHLILLDELEAADISFMPIGRAPENDRGPRHFGGELFGRRTTKENWGFRRWGTSWGIQMYTGIPSERNGARWHDLDFTYQAVCDAPDAVLTCIETLVSSVANPLLTQLESGGLRFSCRIPDYLHPNTDEQKLYIYKHTATENNPYHREVYLKILGENGYSRWDGRYEILLGNLLDPPIIVKEALFAPVDALRALLHQPAPETLKHITVPAMPLRLGSHQLDLAKEAFIKHGFSYVRRDSEFHYWIPSAEMRDVEVLLWENDKDVWVRASTPDVGIPTAATPITEVWDDTGIVPPVPKTGLPVTDKMLAVRQGLSPLSIKRPSPILQKTDVRKKNAIQMRYVREGDETHQLYAITEKRVPDLFTRCMLSKKTLEEWSTNWQGCVLGNFAKTLLNALEIKGRPHSDAVKAVRAAIQSFQWQEEALIRQMCDTHTDTQDPQQTYWHQLRRFFAYYTRDADAPIQWDGGTLYFWVPPVLHPSVKRLLVMSSTCSERHLRRAFPDEEIEVFHSEPTQQSTSNQIFQIRTGIYPRETLLDYDSTWDVMGVSKTGQDFLLGIRAEIERNLNVKHAIIADQEIIQPLQDIIAKENVCFLESFQDMISAEMPFQKINTETLQTAFEPAAVIWIIGAPGRPQGLIWRRAQILFGNHEDPISYYESEMGSNSYTDQRVQSIYEQEAVSLLTEVIESIGLNHTADKKIVLLTGLRLPNITDSPDTLLFDWEDFQVAGGLEKLSETIATRQRFETQRDTLTGKSSRQDVERIFGCSSRQANRILQKLRDGVPLRLRLGNQILDALGDGEKKTAEIIAAVDGYPTATKKVLKRLLDAGEIVKVKRGIYTLPKTETHPLPLSQILTKEL